MGNETRAERRAREDAELDSMQTPFGFFVLGQSYIQSAMCLAKALEDPATDFQLQYQHPIRELYSHGWELCLKACLFEQGVKPSQFKSEIGHSLSKAWHGIERDRFASLRFTDDLERLLKILDEYHGTKLYSYPVSGWHSMPTYRLMNEASGRLLLPPSEVGKLFTGSKAFPKASN